MRVEKNRRLAGGAEPFAVGVRQRIAGAEDVYVVQAGLAHLLADERRGPLDLGRCSPSVLMLLTATSSARLRTIPLLIFSPAIQRVTHSASPRFEYPC